MKRLVWILVASYVGLAVGLFYSLAIDATDLFVLLAAVLVVLAGLQWIMLSGSRRRVRPHEVESVRRG